MATIDLMALVYADGQPFVPELPNGKPRCRGKAKSRGGAQCEYPTVPGATVCRTHGGSAPQVIRAGNLRLIELYQPAISTLAREMATAPKSSDRIRAANSLLDRIGVARNSEMTAEQAMEFLLAEADKFRAELDAQAALEERTIEGETG